jgi:hypothetical protein
LCIFLIYISLNISFSSSFPEPFNSLNSLALPLPTHLLSLFPSSG